MTKKSFRFSDIRPDASRDVDDELAFHLEMRTREFMEQGMSYDDARREAAQSFGNIQDIRGDLRSGRAERNEERASREWWSDFWQDLKYSVRALANHRGFALAAITTLALGIGANSAIFSIVNGVLLRPLPFPNADRLVVVHGRYPEFGRTTTSLPDFLDWRAGTTASFAHMAARFGTAFNYTGGEEPVQLRGDRVTANFFETLGVSPMLGRSFIPAEELGGDDFVVVISHGFWQRQFGGDPRILGQTIQLSGQPHTIIGVARPGFRFWRDVDLWAPGRFDPTPTGRRSEYLTVFGRLSPQASIEQARAEVATVVRRLATDYPATNSNISSEVVTLHDQTVADVRPALLVFWAAVGLVLLIACANVANLLMARAAAREREIAVRSALGASRERLMRQLLTESTVVAMAGGVGGLLLAAWGIGALRATGTPLLPRLAELQVDVIVVAFSLVLALLTGVLFGFAPALRLVSNKLHESIKEGSRGAAGGSVTRFRNALVLGEVALAVVLLIGAGLLMRSFEKLNRVDPGFDPTDVLTYSVAFPAARYEQVSSLVPLYDQLLQRTRAVPGVRTAAVSVRLPMQGSGYNTIAIEGRPSQAAVGKPPEDAQPFVVSPDHFTVMGIRLQSGRLLEPTDVEGSLDVAVVNTELVRTYMSGRNPLGARITFGDPADTTSQWWTVVGVVEVVAQEGLDAKPYAQIYLPIAQAPRRSIFVTAKTDGDPMKVVAGMRQALRSVDSELPMNDVKTMDQRVADSIAVPRVSVALLSIFAALAMVLAGIGIYGVLSYAVTQRTREIGIRMALGANASNVRLLIVRQGMTPALVGLALGLMGALLVTRLMSRLLFGVGPNDPLTFAAVALFLASIAFIASYVPARRATLVAPTEALRYD